MRRGLWLSLLSGGCGVILARYRESLRSLHHSQVSPKESLLACGVAAVSIPEKEGAAE